MSSDDAVPLRDDGPLFIYGGGSRLVESRENGRRDGLPVTTYCFCRESPKPLFQFTHDKVKRLFFLTWTDGRVERFRDRPARQLMVEPDPRTGAMRPMIDHGQPVYVYLCREERERA